MSKPSFQFYPADWRSDVKLRRCGWAARGAWIELLCFLHDAEEYGVWRHTLRELAKTTNIPLRLLKEVEEKGLLRGNDHCTEPFVYAPYSGGSYGASVVLVPMNGGPCWYCKRLVTQHHGGHRRGASSRFNSDSNQPNPRKVRVVKEGMGERQGDGSSTSSSAPSSSSSKNSVQNKAVRTSVEIDALAADACSAMKLAGCDYTDREHPALVQALKDGVTIGQLTDAVERAVGSSKKKPFAWAIKVAHNDALGLNCSPYPLVKHGEPLTKQEKPVRIPASPETAKKNMAQIGAILRTGAITAQLQNSEHNL